MTGIHAETHEFRLYPVAHPRARAFRISLALAALGANAAVGSPLALIGIFLIGLAAVLFHRLKGIPTPVPYLAVTAALIFGLTPALLRVGPSKDLLWIAVRFASGVTWLSLLSTMVSWTELKKALGRFPATHELAEFADSSVAHGLIFLNEIRRRRELAYLRLFREGKRRLGLREVSWAMAGGLEHSFARMIKMEETRTARLAQAPPGFVVSGSEGIRFSNVMYQNGGIRILEQVSFSLKGGEWLVVAGASGAGKTSLLRLASGLSPVSAGSITRLGTELLGGEPLRKRVHQKIAFVSQDPHEQILGSTPLDDLVLGLKAHGMCEEESEQRAIAMLSDLGLSDLAIRPVSRLSYGQLKRVGFAAALVCEPRLLLCDEPTSGLDPVAAAKLISALESVAAKKPLTVIWATHDWNRIPGAVSRVLLLKNGGVFFDGDRHKALSRETLTEAGLEPRTHL